MPYQTCQKCRIAAAATSEIPTSLAGQFLKWVVSHRRFHCSNCGHEWSVLDVISDPYIFMERLIYLLLVAGISYLLWGFITH